MEILSLMPLFLVVFYLAIFGLVVWFAVKFATALINAQNERNQILREISKQLKGMKISKKEE